MPEALGTGTDTLVRCRTPNHTVSFPRASCATETHMLKVYRYSWDKEDLIQYHWKDHYVKQPEVLAYLQHVVERYDLRKYMQFNTELEQAQYDETKNVWRVECSTGDTITARYLITALGLLSKTNYPDIPGIEAFQGELYHTGWVAAIYPRVSSH